MSSQPIPITAQDWNHLFDLAAAIALIALAIVIGAMVFFVIYYRQRKGEKFIPEVKIGKTRPRDNVIFASISIIILVGLVAASYRLAPNPRFEPSGSGSDNLVINVTAFQWGFRFDYPNGVSSVDQLNLPGNTTVMFNVTSTDVMHNFYLVEFRVSTEAIPGRYNVLWVTTPAVSGNQEYNYNIRCKELCGIGHTFMDATMTVMNQTAYNDWLASQNATSTSAGG